MSQTQPSWAKRVIDFIFGPPAELPPERPLEERREPELHLMDPTMERAEALAQVQAMTVHQLFNVKRFKFYPVFQFNRISVRNLQNRKAILLAIKSATKEQFMSLHFFQRKMILGLLHQEMRRYYGTAVRQVDTHGGKKGTPLPRLAFPTPADASEYRTLVQDTITHVRSLLPAPKQSIVEAI